MNISDSVLIATFDGLDSERLFNRPVEVEATRDSLAVKACKIGPFLQGTHHSIVFYQAVACAIVLLSTHCSPTTIKRLIMSLWVNAVNRVATGRRLTHISKKVFKFMPTVADLYAFGAIFMKATRLWIFTTLKHITPCRINFRSRHAMSCVSFYTNGAENILIVAATRFTTAVTKELSLYNALNSTATTTKKLRVFIPSILSTREYEPAAKSFSGEVFKWGHYKLLLIS